MNYSTVFYEAGDDLDKKGAYPGDEAAAWYCRDVLHRDLFGRGQGELALVAFQATEQDGPRGKRTYVKARFRRIR